MSYIAAIGAGFFIGWLYAHHVIATECKRLGKFYVGKETFVCKEIHNDEAV